MLRPAPDRRAPRYGEAPRRVDSASVDLPGICSRAEIKQVGEKAAAFPGRQNILYRAFAQSLDRTQAVDDLVIDKEFRGLGLSKKLITFANKTASEKGCLRVDLEVALTNEPAINAYEKHEYKKVAYLMKHVI